jgi:hypothetical protein
MSKNKQIVTLEKNLNKAGACVPAIIRVRYSRSIKEVYETAPAEDVFWFAARFGGEEILEKIIRQAVLYYLRALDIEVYKVAKQAVYMDDILEIAYPVGWYAVEWARRILKAERTCDMPSLMRHLLVKWSRKHGFVVYSKSLERDMVSLIKELIPISVLAKLAK